MPQQPNILFVITDQQRADTLGAYGSQVGATPNLDRFASESTLFERPYCTNPLCMPARASLLTGLYPSASGVRTNGCTAHAGLPLLPELLAQAGYHTAAFGKVHYHCFMKRDLKWGHPEDRYVNEAEVAESGMAPYLGFETVEMTVGHGDVLRGSHARMLERVAPEFLNRRGPHHALTCHDETIRYAHKIQTYKPSIPPELHPTTFLVDRAIDFLERSGDKPFFVWLGIPDPHHPFCPPGKYWDRFPASALPDPIRREGELDDKPPHFRAFLRGDYAGLDTDGFLLGRDPYLSDDRVRAIRSAYYGMTSLVDDQLGRLFRKLDETGLAENTVVVFTSDHGEFLGDHGFVLKGPMHYENLLRVPFMVRWPEQIAAGRRVETPLSMIDVYPTLLEAASVPCPDHAAGTSILPMLRGDAQPSPRPVLVENDVDALGLRLRTLITQRWKLTAYAGQPYGELYDLEQDPHEFTNLWADSPHRKELQAELLDVTTSSQPWSPPKLGHA